MDQTHNLHNDLQEIPGQVCSPGRPALLHIACSLGAAVAVSVEGEGGERCVAGGALAYYVLEQ